MKLIQVYKSSSGLKVDVSFTTGELMKIAAMMQSFLSHSLRSHPLERIALNRLKKVIAEADIKMEDAKYPKKLVEGA